MKVYGGHATVSPQPLTLDNGAVLLTQYADDFAIRTDDDLFQWVIVYNIRVDVPVAI